MAENEKTNEWKKKELGALWKRTSKAGENYLNGKISLKNLGIEKEVSVIIFSNKDKTQDNHPDLRVYISEPKNETPNKPVVAAKAPRVGIPPTVAQNENNVLI